MNLDGERAYPTSGFILENEDLYRFARSRTRAEGTASHLSHAGCLVAHDLALCPLVDIDVFVRYRLEQIVTIIVMPRSVVPMVTIGYSKLQAAESIANRCGSTPDENGGVVISYDLPDVEDPTETPDLLLVVVDPSSSDASTMDGTIFDDPFPCFGGGPAIEGFAIKHGAEIGVTVGVSACFCGAQSSACRAG